LFDRDLIPYVIGHQETSSGQKTAVV